MRGRLRSKSKNWGYMNKYGARRTYSELCGRWFHSKAEAVRGEDLALLERAGEISDLKYQVPFRLCDKPRITITIDFSYVVVKDYYDYSQTAHKHDFHAPVRVQVYEDVKGMLIRDFRTKLAWLKEKYGVTVLLTK